jgi:uncharacterized membrane protein YgdD (TMEM256/DUF423 family)
MNQKKTLIAGATLGLLGVALGAFGAHALKALLTANGRTETFELAVRYEFYHSLALLFIGLMMEKFDRPVIRGSTAFLLIGVILFSGSLFLFAVTNTTTFAMITPVGGLALLMGWVLLLFAVVRKEKKN